MDMYLPRFNNWLLVVIFILGTEIKTMNQGVLGHLYPGSLNLFASTVVCRDMVVLTIYLVNYRPIYDDFLLLERASPPSERM